MKLSQVLFSQGFGARRECEGLIVSGHVALNGTVCDDPWFVLLFVHADIFNLIGERFL